MKGSTQPHVSENDGPYGGPTGNAYRLGYLRGFGYTRGGYGNKYKSKAHRLAYSSGFDEGQRVKASKQIDPRVKAARETTRAAEAAHIKENGL